MKRIKKLSERLQTGGFSTPYPIGIDGIYADMLSGSNLEEELHLGSPTETSFDVDGDDNMVITEEYKKNGSQTEDYYVMVTTFEVQNNEMTIVQKLSFIDSAGTTLKRTKTVTFETVGDNLKIKEVVS